MAYCFHLCMLVLHFLGYQKSTAKGENQGHQGVLRQKVWPYQVPGQNNISDPTHSINYCMHFLNEIFGDHSVSLGGTSTNPRPCTGLRKSWKLNGNLANRSPPVKLPSMRPPLRHRTHWLPMILVWPWAWAMCVMSPQAGKGGCLLNNTLCPQVPCNLCQTRIYPFIFICEGFLAKVVVVAKMAALPRPTTTSRHFPKFKGIRSLRQWSWSTLMGWTNGSKKWLTLVFWFVQG